MNGNETIQIGKLLKPLIGSGKTLINQTGQFGFVNTNLV